MLDCSNPVTKGRHLALLRPGRKRVTTSFTLKPDLHNWFREAYPEHGDRSRVLEQLIELLKQGKVKVEPKSLELKLA